MRAALTPKVTIMVPVYKTAPYIQRCLVSLFEQTFEDIEYIIVNDATPDNAMDIVCDMISVYPQRDVKIINHPVNKGVGAVRNTALNAATGRYLIYVDSDDWVEKNMIERMVSVAENENADMVLADYYVDYKNNKTSYVSLANVIKKSSDYAELLFSGEIHLFTWNKLISRKLYTDSAINFIEGTNMWEDVATIPRLGFFAKHIAYLPEAFVHYVQYNPNSYTTSYPQNSIIEMQKAIETLDIFLHEQRDSQKYKTALERLKLGAKLSWFIHTQGNSRKELMSKYPEADAWTNEIHSFYYRWIMMLVRQRQYWLADCILFLLKQSKKVISR